MPVNGIELKEGQIWEDNAGIQRTIKRNPSGSVDFPWIGENTEGGGYNTLTNDGRFNGADYYYYDLNKLIYNPESEEKTAMANKFNPKSEPTKLFLPQPGDKIICNNGEEFICCTKEQLKMCIDVVFETKDIVGLTKPVHGWQDWNADGTTCLGYGDWAIREVVPQSSEVTAHKKEEVKEEPRYTVDEVFDALFEETKHIDIEVPWDYIDDVKEHLSRKNDPQYMEYLRLKAIYE